MCHQQDIEIQKGFQGVSAVKFLLMRRERIQQIGPETWGNVGPAIQGDTVMKKSFANGQNEWKIVVVTTQLDSRSHEVSAVGTSAESNSLDQNKRALPQPLL